MQKRTYLDKGIKLFSCIIICELAGMLGSYFTIPQINGWYNTLQKPSFNPPNWLFGPVWTTLFVLMGISLYIVWSKNWETQKTSKNKNVWNAWSKKLLDGDWSKINIILIFCTQLLLNVLWSLIFFGMHSLGFAFFELLMLWFAILFTIINFYRISRIAALLLVPYIIWVSFAGFLNYFLWIIN